MKVLEFQPAKCVKWRVIDDPKLAGNKHQDWKESVEFMPHCSTDEFKITFRNRERPVLPK